MIGDALTKPIPVKEIMIDCLDASPRGSGYRRDHIESRFAKR